MAQCNDDRPTGRGEGDARRRDEMAHRRCRTRRKVKHDARGKCGKGPRVHGRREEDQTLTDVDDVGDCCQADGCGDDGVGCTLSDRGGDGDAGNDADPDCDRRLLALPSPSQPPGRAEGEHAEDVRLVQDTKMKARRQKEPRQSNGRSIVSDQSGRCNTVDELDTPPRKTNDGTRWGTIDGNKNINIAGRANGGWNGGWRHGAGSGAGSASRPHGGRQRRAQCGDRGPNGEKVDCLQVCFRCFKEHTSDGITLLTKDNAVSRSPAVPTDAWALGGAVRANTDLSGWERSPGGWCYNKDEVVNIWFDVDINLLDLRGGGGRTYEGHPAGAGVARWLDDDSDLEHAETTWLSASKCHEGEQEAGGSYDQTQRSHTSGRLITGTRHGERIVICPQCMEDVPDAKWKEHVCGRAARGNTTDMGNMEFSRRSSVRQLINHWEHMINPN